MSICPDAACSRVLQFRLAESIRAAIPMTSQQGAPVRVGYLHRSHVSHLREKCLKWRRLNLPDTVGTVNSETLHKLIILPGTFIPHVEYAQKQCHSILLGALVLS